MLLAGKYGEDAVLLFSAATMYIASHNLGTPDAMDVSSKTSLLCCVVYSSAPPGKNRRPAFGFSGYFVIFA